MLTHKKFVFILGAGASQGFNFPSGPGLRAHMITKLSDAESIESHAMALTQLERGHVEAFIKALSRSSTSSVDAFIEKRSDLMEIGKFAIAACLIPYEMSDTLFDPQIENWYSYLYRHMAEDAKTPEEFCKNKVSFITYNYDRSLEECLGAALATNYLLNSDQVKSIFKSIPIVHVHGQLGEHVFAARTSNTRLYNPKLDDRHYIYTAAQGIKIIHEDIDSSEEFEQARALLKDADIVCFLGFGYFDRNLARLRLSKSHCELFYGTTYGLMSAELQNIRDKFKGRSFYERPGKIIQFFKTTGILFPPQKSVFDG